MLPPAVGDACRAAAFDPDVSDVVPSDEVVDGELRVVGGVGLVPGCGWWAEPHPADQVAPAAVASKASPVGPRSATVRFSRDPGMTVFVAGPPCCATGR